MITLNVDLAKAYDITILIGKGTRRMYEVERECSHTWRWYCYKRDMPSIGESQWVMSETGKPRNCNVSIFRHSG